MNIDGILETVLGGQNGTIKFRSRGAVAGRLYVLPRFGSRRIDEIRREDVKRFLTELRGRGLAKNTIRLAATTLRAVLSAATEDQLINQNPAQGLGRFVKSEKPQREATSLKPNEVQLLLRKAEHDLSLREYALLLTALRAGLREGELAALQWGDIQFGESEQDVVGILWSNAIMIGAGPARCLQRRIGKLGGWI